MFEALSERPALDSLSALEETPLSGLGPVGTVDSSPGLQSWVGIADKRPSAVGTAEFFGRRPTRCSAMPFSHGSAWRASTGTSLTNAILDLFDRLRCAAR